MRGAGIALALAKYMTCPTHPHYAEWIPGAYIECEDCPLNKPAEDEVDIICEMLRRIDEAMEVTDESELQ